MNSLCKECMGKCCTTMEIVCSKREYTRIFRYVAANHDSDFHELLEKTRNLYYSKVRISRSTETCPFLKYGRCLIYPVRPDVCKDMVCYEERKNWIEASYNEINKEERTVTGRVKKRTPNLQNNTPKTEDSRRLSEVVRKRMGHIRNTNKK